jgi:outer membrane protein assembly factor BamB
MLASSLVALALVPFLPGQENRPGVDWPSFRGPNASGVAEGFATVTEWDIATGKNVLWRVEIPGLAHSSPVIHGDRLFLTTAVRKEGGDPELTVGLYGSITPVRDEGEQLFRVLCLDKKTGKELWSRTAFDGQPIHPRHPKGSYAAPTPATDGKRVVACFGSEGLMAYSMEGPRAST